MRKEILFNDNWEFVRLGFGTELADFYEFAKGKTALFHSYSAETASNWQQIGKGTCTVKDNRIVIGLPVSLLKAKDGEKLRLCFKWSDNMQNENNPIDWIINGDAAPNGRALYRWVEK